MAAEGLLRRVPLFVDLTDVELAALVSSLSRRVFARGMILYNKGSPAQNLYLIESGAVRIFALSEMGQEITLDVYGPGECFGESALVEGHVRAAGAVAAQRTVVYTLRRDDLLRYVEGHPRITKRLMALLAHRLDYLTAYAENLAFFSVGGRVAAVLADLAARQAADDGNIEIDLRLTQTELASWVCATREMVNRVLQAYRDQGLITIEGHKVVVLDLAGLRRKITH